MSLLNLFVTQIFFLSCILFHTFAFGNEYSDCSSDLYTQIEKAIPKNIWQCRNKTEYAYCHSRKNDSCTIPFELKDGLAALDEISFESDYRNAEVRVEELKQLSQKERTMLAQYLAAGNFVNIVFSNGYYTHLKSISVLNKMLFLPGAFSGSPHSGRENYWQKVRNLPKYEMQIKDIISIKEIRFHAHEESSIDYSELVSLFREERDRIKKLIDDLDIQIITFNEGSSTYSPSSYKFNIRGDTIKEVKRVLLERKFQML